MGDKVFTMRIDEDLLEKIRVSAETNKRSIAKEIEFILEMYINYGPPEIDNTELISLMKEILETDGFKEYIKSTKKHN